MKALVAFRAKLLTPCRKLLRIFRLKLKRPLSIKPLKALRRAKSAAAGPPKPKPKPKPKPPPNSLLLLFPRRRRQRKMDRVMELRSNMSEAEHDGRKLLTSPVTPAYIKAFRSGTRFGDEVVEDACRSFENYLVEMVVEEGKMRDLMDVEDLLYCWKNLKCPVFIDLVCTFYGELCKDLFAPDHDEIEIHKTSSPN